MPQASDDVLRATLQGSNEALERLSRAYSDLRFERTPTGTIVVMNPTKPFTGKRNSQLAQQLTAWANQDGTGEAYDSSTGWTLPGVGSVRSPDASWLKKARWDALTPEQQDGFSEICPDFVIELLSDPRALPDEQAKMLEYMAAGASLGWLIDPFKREVWVYRPSNLPSGLADPQCELIKAPQRIDASPELPGFVLELARIW